MTLLFLLNTAAVLVAFWARGFRPVALPERPVVHEDRVPSSHKWRILGRPPILACRIGHRDSVRDACHAFAGRSAAIWNLSLVHVHGISYRFKGRAVVIGVAIVVVAAIVVVGDEDLMVVVVAVTVVVVGRIFRISYL